jgi:ABC-2 type transport system permease protein
VTAAVATSGIRPLEVHPDLAVAGRVFRQLRKGALAIGLTFGAVAASAAVTYVQSFPTVADRVKVAASLKGDSAFAVLFGRIDAIDTVGGYTAYKSYVTISTIGAIWGALAATRLLRGEEDSGRWQLLLAGRTNAVRVTVATLAALAGAIGLVFVGTAVPMWLAGLKDGVGSSIADDVVLGLSAMVAPIAFVAVGSVCSQLTQTRRLANELSMGVLAVAFVLRMIADSGPGTRWLLWATPLGWAELMRPVSSNDLWPLVPVAVIAVVGGTLALVLAARRDTGGGVLASHDVTPVRPFGLQTPLGLATRLSAPVLAGWTVAIAATGFVMGIVAKPAAAAIDDSSLTTTLQRLGATGTGAKAYLGVVFLLIGAVLALVPASQIGAAAEEETSGRLGQIVAGRSSRTRWFGGRLGLAAAAVVAMGLLSGVAAWAGARSQGVHVPVGDLVVAGANVVPAALLALAVGAFALAVTPRGAGTVVYALVAGSFVIDLLGSLITALEPLTRLSIFHYVSLAPAQDPDWTALGTMTLVALALAGAAIGLLERRDLVRD